MTVKPPSAQKYFELKTKTTWQKDNKTTSSYGSLGHGQWFLTGGSQNLIAKFCFVLKIGSYLSNIKNH